MYDVKFLESIANLKAYVKAKLGWEPNTKKAQAISSYLIQGRLFFQAAKNAPIEIKPLQLYYGVMAFARAIILVHTKESIDYLKPSHGVTAKMSNSLASSMAVINSSGTFFDFNNVICELDGINYFIKSKPFIEKIPSSSSDKFINKKITIKDVLSRIPGLEDLYFNTFNGEYPKNRLISIYVENERDGDVKIDISDAFKVIETREDLIDFVRDVRESYPFLNKWCLIYGAMNWGSARLFFKNLEKNDVNDLSEEFLINQGNASFKASESALDSMKKFNFVDFLQPLTGFLSKSNQHMSENFDGEYISEFSLYYLGTFILSSVARYKPNIWMSAITHSIVADESSDDALLAIIEKFMDIVIKSVPGMVVGAFETV